MGLVNSLPVALGTVSIEVVGGLVAGVGTSAADSRMGIGRGRSLGFCMAAQALAFLMADPAIPAIDLGVQAVSAPPECLVVA